MGPNHRFLCLVIDRTTKATLREYPEIVAENWCNARWQAANRYVEEIGSLHGDWYVDSLELD
jgi:hypothetical protein